MTDKLIIITGPTASGKSDFAISLAQKLDSEIISCDSQQVYKDMDIGTNKTLEKDLGNIRQNLVSLVNPDQEFSVKDYSDLALSKISQINEKGKIPILVGGTGLYIDSILYEMNYGQSTKNPEIRRKYENLAKKNGPEYIYRILEEIDPVTAENYHPNELNRVVRALETYEETGRKPSQIRRGKNKLNSNLAPILFFINYKDRKLLYETINKRVLTMIDSGLEDEFKFVVNKYGLDENSKALAAIGYKEFFSFYNNCINRDKLIDLIQKNSRHYAKRQITWMKKYLKEDFSYIIYRDEKSDEEIKRFMEEKIEEKYKAWK